LLMSCKNRIFKKQKTKKIIIKTLFEFNSNNLFFIFLFVCFYFYNYNTEISLKC